MDAVISGIIFCHFVKLASLYYISEKSRKRKVKVGVVSGINLYPGKALGGIAVTEARCTTWGLQYDNLRDRHWMVTDSTYTFVSQREEPRLVLIQCTQITDGLELSAPGITPLVLPLNLSSCKVITCSVFKEDVEAVNCGSEATAWIEKFLNKSGFHIVYAPWKLKKRYLTDSIKPLIKDADQNAQVAFANSTPFMLANERSLEDLNSRLQNKVTMQNFRPNITITGSSAFEEDNWSDVFINDATFKKVKLCERCPQITVHTDSGIKDPQFEPLKTLRKYRIPAGYIKACFGLSLALEQEGTIHLNDDVYAVINIPD